VEKIVTAVLVDDKVKVVGVKKKMDHNNVVVEKKNWVEENEEECCSSYMRTDFCFVFVVNYKSDEGFV
jgi:predicted PolB exonuclease-like 3'-5' exonuclease